MYEKERKLYERQIEKFLERLKKASYEDEVLLEAAYSKYTGQAPFQDRKAGSFRKIKCGERWGSNWERAWFRLSGQIPSTWKGEKVVARLNLGGEGCIFDEDGTPVQAISCHAIWMAEFSRDRYPIADKARGGEAVELWIDATAAELFGLKLQDDPTSSDPKRFGHHEAEVQDLALAVFREDIWHLHLDATVLNNLMRALPEDSVRRAKLLTALRTLADGYTSERPDIARLRDGLKSELQKRRNASALTATATGHAHIDTAWLWPLSETIKKCARTFSTQIAMIRKYPGYIFGASQAQHYQFVKDEYPSLYEQIAKCIKNGSWEVQGGMWVEADCNLISGESMVRQFLHGIRFFEREFGVRVRNLWLPDVFGYSAAMPQILKKCGLSAMVTQKISWNQFNKFPHHSFVWRGIDGSEVVVHFPPEDTYNSELKPSGLRYAQANFSEKGIFDEFLVLFGIGDGGGGPTEEQIESGLRQQDLEGSPGVRFGHAQEMLDRLVAQEQKLPRWVGELYLELHRGTLTTQAYNKYMNRKMELRLRELEFLFAAFAMEAYPRTELDAIWKTVLLNQFHDIIPGSSIHVVYEDSRRDYDRISRQSDGLFQKLTASLATGDETVLCLVNTLSTPYASPVTLPESWTGCEILDENRNKIDSQLIARRTMVLPELPGLSAKTLIRGEKAAGREEASSGDALDSGFILENDLIRYEFAPNGSLVQAFDKECHREVLGADQTGNNLELYEDLPNDWEAWDIDLFYEQQKPVRPTLLRRTMLGEGPLLLSMHLELEIGNSSLSQTITLARNSKRLEFRTTVGWKERRKMLRVAFEVQVRADAASYEIQYGVVQRPTHRNTSWDLARFEVAGHRFADLSDRDYGVALLNDCKYGHKVLDNRVELTLLRAPLSPDPEADVGDHRFTYAFLPHAGALQDSNVLSEARQLNQPVTQLPGVDGSNLQFPFKLDTDSVVVEVLKRAEDSQALVIRLYEPVGNQVSATLQVDDNELQAYETDLLEDNAQPIAGEDGEFRLQFAPFEIKTVMLRHETKR